MRGLHEVFFKAKIYFIEVQSNINIYIELLNTTTSALICCDHTLLGTPTLVPDQRCRQDEQYLDKFCTEIL